MPTVDSICVRSWQTRIRFLTSGVDYACDVVLVTGFASQEPENLYTKISQRHPIMAVQLCQNLGAAPKLLESWRELASNN